MENDIINNIIKLKKEWIKRNIIESKYALTVMINKYLFNKSTPEYGSFDVNAYLSRYGIKVYRKGESQGVVIKDGVVRFKAGHKNIPLLEKSLQELENKIKNTYKTDLLGENGLISFR